MQLQNEFTVDLPPEQAWTLLTDLKRVAPCLPGAAITSQDGDEFHGRAKIKLGPITAQYTGTARFEELDAANFRAVMLARGKDSRGQGDASATVTALLTPNGSGTRVLVDTDLALTGKVAQFGRGVLAEVSGSLMDLFAERLEEMVNGQAAEDAPAEPSPAVAPGASDDQTRSLPKPARRDDEVLDVLALAGGASWMKILPSAGTCIAVVAALVSVFAAGYASGRARGLNR